MNIVRTLTLRHLKENKGRTVVTILGIIVAVAMITAVFVGMSSLLNVTGQAMRNDTGDYEFQAYVNDSSIEKLKKDSRVKTVGIGVNSENTNDHREVCSPAGHDSPIYTTTYVAGDENYFKQFIVSKYEGTLPKNENEIAVDKSYFDLVNDDTNSEIHWKVGDKVKLDYGNYYNKKEDYETSFNDDGTKYRKAGSKYVTVTAILDYNSPTPMIITGWDKNCTVDIKPVYVKLKEVGFNTRNKIKSIAKDCGIDKYSFEYNGEYILCQGDLTFIDQYKDMIPLIGAVLAIIIVASVMLVYNAFSMSLTDRIRYLGMLASVGATRKQKRNSVYFEGAFLGMIAIPLGIFFGIIGIDITLNVVINRLADANALSGMDKIDSILSVPVWSIISIIVFSIITIFISAYIPARKSSKISPIDAIRQNDSIKLKARTLKSSKLIRKVFGYEGEIANKNLKRNGKKSRLIIVSITVSIILFLSVNTFCNLFSMSASIDKTAYQVQASCEYDKLDQFNEKLSQIKNIDKIYMINKDVYGFEKVNGFKQDIYNHITPKYKDKYGDDIAICMHIIDDDTFNKICKDNNIDTKNYYDGKTTKMVLVNSVGDKSNEDPVLTDDIKNKNLKSQAITTFESTIIDYSEDDEYGDSVVIGDFIKYDEDNPVFKLDNYEDLTGFIPISQYVNSKNLTGDNVQIEYGIETKEHEQVSDDINDIPGKCGKLYVYDVQASRESANSIIFTVRVFVYGFITLITLITIFNIINTISTGIAMRKREFAMLRSVGVSKKGFYKIVCLESVLYGLKSLIIGLPLSFVISYGMNKALGSSAYPFTFDYKMYLIVIVAVFLIVGLTMFYAVNKIKKGSIIEALKEDID